MVDLTLDDSPVDKGKHVVGVEGVEATNQAGPSMAVEGADAADQVGPSAAPVGDLAGSLVAWPDLAGLALVRVEEELPHWGASLEFRDASNPGAEPIFALNDEDEVHHWEYLEGLCQHTV
jgi:hypothetical protein